MPQPTAPLDPTSPAGRSAADALTSVLAEIKVAVRARRAARLATQHAARTDEAA